MEVRKEGQVAQKLKLYGVLYVYLSRPQRRNYQMFNRKKNLSIELLKKLSHAFIRHKGHSMTNFEEHITENFCYEIHQYQILATRECGM